jgi:hypothetical protein
MKRSLLVAALCMFTASAHSMTASVSTASPPAGSPAAPGTSSTTSAAPAPSTKAAIPSAAPVTKPAAALSAPGVPPMKPAAAVGARTGVAPTKANTFMPSSANQATAVTAPVAASTPWTATARGSSSMRRGTLETFNATAGTFQVYGQKLNFNAQRVKVFNRDGRPGSVFALKSGAKVRFTMDTADPAQRRVAVIYVD